MPMKVCPLGSRLLLPCLLPTPHHHEPWNHKPRYIYFPKLFLVMVLSHSNNKVTSTSVSKRECARESPGDLNILILTGGV